MKKCEQCYLRDAKPCYECSACARGDDHFHPVEKLVENKDKTLLEEALMYMLTNGVELNMTVSKYTTFKDNTICIQMYPNKELQTKYRCDIHTVPVYSRPNESDIANKIKDGTDLVLRFIQEKTARANTIYS